MQPTFASLSGYSCLRAAFCLFPVSLLLSVYCVLLNSCSPCCLLPSAFCLLLLIRHFCFLRLLCEHEVISHGDAGSLRVVIANRSIYLPVHLS